MTSHHFRHDGSRHKQVELLRVAIRSHHWAYNRGSGFAEGF